MRRPVTDIALLDYIAKKNASVISYSEATKACKSSSSASRVLHQLIGEGILNPQPKLLGLRYVTQYVVTPKGKQAATLAFQLTRLRETAAKMEVEEETDNAGEGLLETQNADPEESVPLPSEPVTRKKKEVRAAALSQKSSMKRTRGRKEAS